MSIYLKFSSDGKGVYIKSNLIDWVEEGDENDTILHLSESYDRRNGESWDSVVVDQGIGEVIEKLQNGGAYCD